MRALLMSLTLFLSLGCGPKDVIPTAPTHPANPEAPGQPKTEGPAMAAPDAGPASTSEPHAVHEDGEKAAIAAAETAAYQRAQPTFQRHCSRCHSASGKKATTKRLAHFSIDTYPFGGHHADEIGATVRKVLGVTGKKPTMPRDAPGRVKGAELEAIVGWSEAFDKAHAAGLHEGGEQPGHGDHH